MNLVADKLGKKQDIVDIGFGPISSGEALDNGDCDVAAAALSITDEREEVMDFSQPYYDADQALAVMPSSNISSLSDLDGKLLGIQIDTTGAEYAAEKQKEYGYEIKTFSNLGKLREAVEYETVSGAIGDVPLWNAETQRNPEMLQVVDRFDTGEEYGYAVAKGNTEMLDTINEVLDDAIKDGTFAKIYKKWIGEQYNG
jgi:polar amino acid transport system substrate-binding protein